MAFDAWPRQRQNADKLVNLGKTGCQRQSKELFRGRTKSIYQITKKTIFYDSNFANNCKKNCSTVISFPIGSASRCEKWQKLMFNIFVCFDFYHNHEYRAS